MQFHVNIDPQVMTKALDLLKVIVIRATTIGGIYVAIMSGFPAG